MFVTNHRHKYQPKIEVLQPETWALLEKTILGGGRRHYSSAELRETCVVSRDASRIKICFLVVKRCSLSIFPTLLDPVLFGILLFQHVVPLSFLRSDYKPPLLICHKHIFTFVHYNGDPCAIRVRIILITNISCAALRS